MNYRIAFVAAVALGSAACRGSGEETNAFQWTSQLPAGSVVHLLDGSGGISVRRATGPSAVVSGSRRWSRGRSTDIKFTVTHTGNDYYVCAMWRASGRCGASGYRGSKGGGLLTMFSLFHRSGNGSADFVAEIPANVAVDAHTSNGSVQIDGMSGGVTARTLNGTVRATNVSGPLALMTTNGDVRLSSDSLSEADSVHLSTTNGSIHAELPANMQGKFDLSVVNGMLKSDFPIPATSGGRIGRHLAGQLGSSTRVVKMRAINGTVSVVSRTAPAAH